VSKPPKQTTIPATTDLPSQSQSTSSKDELEVVERVTETLKPLLKNPAEIKRVVTQVVSITESYSGPMPHPDHLERIEVIAPGSARQIINMAVIEQKFRHRMSLLTILYPYLGLITGFTIALTCFYLAYLLALENHPEVAGAMVGVSSLGVIGWFIKSRVGEKPDQGQLPVSQRNSPKRR
jgi:uncharacterized membrane protein